MRVVFAEVLVLASVFLKQAAAFQSTDGLKRQSENGGAIEVVQAQVPPRQNYDNPSCSQTIFNHVFSDSYGIPYVGRHLKSPLTIN